MEVNSPPKGDADIDKKGFWMFMQFPPLISS